MSDKKLTDEEIIKRLERCVKRGNRNYDTDIVLDLITRQQAEIERYKGVIKILEKDVATAKSEAVKEFAERLKDKSDSRFDYSELVFEIREEDIDNLVKEMAGENNG